MSGIADLANLMLARRKEGKRFVLMLGAGASISSKVPDARTMMMQVLELHGSRIAGTDVEDRFDKLMQGPEDNRRTILRPYLDKLPSSGYEHLAHLIKDGYFDTIVTFNFDTLLEKALHDAGVHDFAVVIRGEIQDDDIPKAMDQPGVKILKLHGSVKGISGFVFTRTGLVEYPPPIGETVSRLTAGDVIVCGYAYNDQCVISSFSKAGPGNVVVVNPSPPRMLLDVAANRKGQFVFSDTDGRFDDFFGKLTAAFQPAAAKRRTDTANPFKFLEAYRPEDQGSFFGREELTSEVLNRFQNQPTRVAFLAGPTKAGKTSFVRAGLMPQLQPTPYYLRCQADLEKWLPAALGRRCGWSSAPELDVALKAIAESAPAGSRVYIILDQFERVVRRFDKRPKGRQEFMALVRRVIEATPDGMTLLCVSDSDEMFLSTLISLSVAQHCLTVQPLDGAALSEIVRKLAGAAGMALAQETTQQLQDRYDNSDPGEPFTLAHVNAICHLLCDTGTGDAAGLKRILDDHGETLNRIINTHDVIGFVEDIPFDEAARALLPRMMKVISKEGRRNLAECLSSHFCELFPTMSYVSKEQGHGV